MVAGRKTQSPGFQRARQAKSGSNRSGLTHPPAGAFGRGNRARRASQKHTGLTLTTKSDDSLDSLAEDPPKDQYAFLKLRKHRSEPSAPRVRQRVGFPVPGMVGGSEPEPDPATPRR